MKTVNAVGAGLGAVGLRLPRLRPDAIIASAEQQSGSTYRASTETTEALERYIESAEAESGLNTLGRLAVRKMLVDALAARCAVTGPMTPRSGIIAVLHRSGGGVQ